MANICARCQCLCLIEWKGSYAKHDAIGKKSFERDTHIGCGSLIDQQVTSKSPARLVIALQHEKLLPSNDTRRVVQH